MLNRLYPNLELTVDGICSDATLNGWGRWENDNCGTGRPRVPDRTSFEALAKKAGWDITGEKWED